MVPGCTALSRTLPYVRFPLASTPSLYHGRQTGVYAPMAWLGKLSHVREPAYELRSL